MSIEFLLDVFEIDIALNLVIVSTCLLVCGIIAIWRIK